MLKFWKSKEGVFCTVLDRGRTVGTGLAPMSSGEQSFWPLWGMQVVPNPCPLLTIHSKTYRAEMLSENGVYVHHHILNMQVLEFRSTDCKF